MNISELRSKASRLEKDLQVTRDLLAQATHDPEAATADLARSRAYAFNCAALPLEEVVAGCVDSLSRYGFCVIDNVIPADEVDGIREEVVGARSAVKQNMEGIVELFDQGASAEQLLGTRPLIKQLHDALHVLFHGGPRPHNFLADAIHLVGWNDIVDNAESVSAQRVDTTGYNFLEWQRRTVEGVRPAAGQIGGGRLGVVGCLGQEIASHLQVFLQPAGLGTQLGDVHASPPDPKQWVCSHRLL